DSVPTIRATFRALVLFILLSLLLKLSLTQFDFSNNFILILFIAFSVLLLAWKVTFLFIRRPTRWSLIKYKNVVIVGAGPLGIDLHDHITEHKQYGYQVIGFFDDNLTL